MARPSSHRKLLLQISDDLTQLDLDSLLFCCGDDISESEAKKVSKGTDLFIILGHRNLLGPGEYGYLRECLTTIERRDLASRLPSELDSVMAHVPSCEKSIVQSSAGIGSRFTPPAFPSDKRALVHRDSFVSPKLQFLQIAEHLSSDDALKLAYLCSIEIREDSGEVSGVKVLLQLEKANIIDPSQPETLARLLQCIERRDLASLLVPMHNLHLVQSLGLDDAQQLLSFKMSMFADQHSYYVFQRRVMRTIANSDKVAAEKQIVKPMMTRLVQSYQYSTVQRLCAGSLETFQKTELNDLLRNTLPLMFDFIDSYVNLLLHCQSCDDGVINISTLEPLFQKCHDYYNRFEAEIGKFPWNSTLRQHVQKDLVQRRTPIGSPAYNAMKCIYDICSELTDKVKVQSVMERVNRNLYILECVFYGFSFRVVLSQWLRNVLCLLAQNAVSDSVVVSYSADVLRSTLVQIVRTHRDQICCCYHKLASMLGKDIMKQISAELLKEGVDITSQEPCHRLPHSMMLDGSELGEYALSIRTIIFLNLFSLLQLSYFGGKDLDLSSILRNMTEFHASIMTSRFYIPCVIRMYRNLIRAYEVQLENFREQVLQSNSQCASVLTKLIPL